MIITQAALVGLYMGYKLDFNKALALESDGPALHQTLCLETTSDSPSEEYDWLGDMPIVQEHAEGAPSKLINLATSKHQIDNVTFDRIIALKKEQIEDDKHGLFRVRVTETGEGTRRAMDYTLARRMVAGFTTLKDYTGTTYFADSKPINKGSNVTFDNKDTKKLSVGNYEAALENLGKRTDAEGVSLNLGGAETTLVVGSKNRALGKKIVENKLVNGGEDNPNLNASKLKVWGYLDQLAADAWFVFITNRVRKPFIKQTRKSFAPSMCTDPNDSHVIKYNEFLFKIEGRMNIGAGESLLAFGSTGVDAA